ncbi:MAG: thymidylate synthase, partial [Myxococcota bacterium]
FTGIRPGLFGHTLVDAHIYTGKADGSMAEYDHIPGLKEQLSRTERPLPKLSIDPSIRSIDDLAPLMELETEELMSHFVLEGYDPHPAIKFKVAV